MPNTGVRIKSHGHSLLGLLMELGLLTAKYSLEEVSILYFGQEILLNWLKRLKKCKKRTKISKLESSRKTCPRLRLSKLTPR